ncbi:hypothetical protein FXW78_28835 [Rhodococcus opacus]|nr:hypothetical protein [Rhodococcus opacus]RZL77209.1 MAG: hypothetical protein EOP32_25835 [Rhodococcus sp. (in: high G+C Gram-positive bacteria)]
MSGSDLARQTAQLRSDLHDLIQRMKELTEAFDARGRESQGVAEDAALIEVIDGLSDARLDLTTADRHLEAAVSHAERIDRRASDDNASAADGEPVG